jgi:2-polyprenyl-3-methyl-5-hydroxy-6-metoxy-1,4-benzoquinol methylase
MAENDVNTLPEQLAQIRERLQQLESVVLDVNPSRIDGHSRPKFDALTLLTKDFENLALNVKFFGYELAQQLAGALLIRKGLTPSRIGLASKPSTQQDIASDWVAFWCSELKIPLVFHRKLWELAYVLQALHENGHLRAGARGLGFGCGQEPLPSYFASRGLSITMTDLTPDDSASLGWAATGQHASSLERGFQSHLVERAQFERSVTLRHVDMNAIPPDLCDYDFCWSICALEHLGSIEKGLAFIENAMDTLKPGGLAVHTTEFNFLNDEETVDNWPTVLFQRKHFIEIATRLRVRGHKVAELYFDVGREPLDRFIDIPPFSFTWNESMRLMWGLRSDHIKVSVDGFASTCFGLIISKAA